MPDVRRGVAPAARVLPIRRRSVRRSLWRALVCVVPLAAAVGAPPAAATSQSFTFAMVLSRAKLTLCTGQKAQYKATVRAYPEGDKSWAIDVPNVRIKAITSDQSIGTFTGSKAGRASAVSNADPSQSVSHGVVFELQAGKKAGKVTLTFYALVDGYGESGEVVTHVDVQVVNCTFEVSAVSNYDKDPTDNPDIPFPSLSPSMKRVKLTVNPADGHIDGTTTMRWTNAFQAGPCTVSERMAGTSVVTITGALDVDTLVLNVTFDGKKRSAKVTCGEASFTGFDSPVVLAPLKMDVDTEGGTYIRPHSYGNSTVAGVKGVMIITVKPVKP